MAINLYGEVIQSIDDICETLEKRAIKNGIYDLRYNLNSKKQGIWTSPITPFALSNLPGFYSIFRNDRLYYIGRTKTCMHNRLSRFVKEVYLKSRPSEKHPAGKKWRTFYGIGNLEGCQVMFSEYYPFEIELTGYTYEQIEEHLIRRHKPLLNHK
jgi:hypothetical protein